MFKFIIDSLNGLQLCVQNTNKLTNANLKKIPSKIECKNKQNIIHKEPKTIYELSEIFRQIDYMDIQTIKNYIKYDIIRLMRDYVSNNSFCYDDNDDLLVICDILYKYDFEKYKTFIYLCPEKFMMCYANNSEHTPQLLAYLDKTDVGLKNYIYTFTDISKKLTWRERYNNSNVF